MAIRFTASRAPASTAPFSSPGRAGQGEGRPVVVGIGVLVDQVAAEGLGHRCDGLGVPALGDVWIREQRGHADCRAGVRVALAAR